MNRLLLICLLLGFTINVEAQVILPYITGNDSLKKVDFSAVEDTSNWTSTLEFELPDIIFDFDKSKLRPQSLIVLDQFVEFLVLHPQLMIEISNHRDCRSSDHYSRNLTQRRAQSVTDYLIVKGIKPQRLITKGYADIKPLLYEGTLLTCEYINSLAGDKEKQDKLHQLNRRTEFKIIATNFSE